MPAEVASRKNAKGETVYRVVEPDGSLVKNKGGSPVDGGGHETAEAAAKQAAAINANS